MNIVLLIVAYVPIKNIFLRAKERYMGSVEEINPDV